MFVAVGTFRHGAVVSLGSRQGGDAILLDELTGNCELILRQVGYFRVIGVDHRVFEVAAGPDLYDGPFDSDELDAVEVALPDQGAAFFPVGEGFAAKHVFFCFGGVGQGVPDAGGGGVDDNFVFYN